MKTMLRYDKPPPGKVLTFPSVDPGLSDAAMRVLYGSLPDPSKYSVCKHYLQSFKSYAAAGATQFKFFNDAPADFITNLPQQGQINDDQFFWGTELHLQVYANTTTAQGVATAIATQMTGAAGIPPNVTNAEELRYIYQFGRVNLRIGERWVVRDCHGLEKFGAGGGPATYGQTAGVNGTNLYSTSSVNNGTPDSSNGFEFMPWVWLARGRTIDLTVDYKTALALTGGGIIVASIEGILITRGNV